MQNNPIVDEDLDHILELTKGLWAELRDQQIFITGGTGFFGAWILHSFAQANKKFGLNASALVLSRNPDSFKTQFPRLAQDPSISFLKGDVKDFKFPKGEYGYIMHMAATNAQATFKKQYPLIDLYDMVAEGTRHVLNFAVECKTKKLLFTSSAPVYGRQPAELTHIPEDYNGAPDPADLSSYNATLGLGKRIAEFFCAYYGKNFGIETKIARCFSFVGPWLPLDIHYAIGNFIRDGLKGSAIQISGDGTARRSYLYAADLTVWLWTILFKGTPFRPYNVGSEQDVSIAELAHAVAEAFGGKINVTIAKSPVSGAKPEKQVPSTKQAQQELDLKQNIYLEEAIKRTIKFYQGGKS